MKVIDEYSEHELKDALDFVANDVDENLQDFVDLRARAEISKKRKLCQSGHINDNVRSNRTICDRQHCKSKLKEGKTDNVTSVCDDVHLDSAEKAKRYLNVPNVNIDDTPKEMAIGAMAINPNSTDRIAKVLDEIVESADMKNKFSLKIIPDGDTLHCTFRKTCQASS